MSRWWRAYDDAASDPKLGLLSDELHRAWFNLMCIASSNDGEFPPIKQIAYTLRVKPERAAAIMAELHGAGLLDKTETGFAPHNWNKRQYKADVTDPTASERMKRYRSNKRNDRNTTVTPLRPETEADTDTDTEKKETRTSAPVDAVASDHGWLAPIQADKAARPAMAQPRDVPASGTIQRSTSRGGNWKIGKSCKCRQATSRRRNIVRTTANRASPR